MEVPSGAKLEFMLDISVTACHVHLYILDITDIMKGTHMLFACRAKPVIEQAFYTSRLVSFIML